MIIRLLVREDLPELLRLYRILHPTDPIMDTGVAEVCGHWESILANPLLRYYGVEFTGKLVSTCTLAIIPNLTRSFKPYGLIENVVTDPEYRQKGYGTAVLKHAVEEAWSAGCYKVMLQTGRKGPEIVRFYENAGFESGVKTAFLASAEHRKSK